MILRQNLAVHVEFCFHLNIKVLVCCIETATEESSCITSCNCRPAHFSIRSPNSTPVNCLDEDLNRLVV